MANIAGITTYTFNNFYEQNFVVMENCIGQAFTTVGASRRPTHVVVSSTL